MEAYPNLLAGLGLGNEQITRRIQADFHTLFFDEEQRIYHETGQNMAYVLDTGNMDARSEGMSYGMMIAVQMDRKDIFDKLWLFSCTHMLQRQGRYQGYFAWSVTPGGEKNAQGPAPDGEEYFAMALFFAAARWGDGSPPFNYSAQAREILHHCLHQQRLAEGGAPMWNPHNYCIKFVPDLDFTDPSYHLPHFYRLFAQRANREDRPFWEKAELASREHLQRACHPQTGMAAEYAEYDGTPHFRGDKGGYFYSDAYRVAMNIGLDAAWNGPDKALTPIAKRLQAFFAPIAQSGEYMTYHPDGRPTGQPAMHPLAITATTAAASLAAAGPHSQEWLKRFWASAPRRGERRYYDNCLYFFTLLMLAGRYRVY